MSSGAPFYRTGVIIAIDVTIAQGLPIRIIPPYPPSRFAYRVVIWLLATAIPTRKAGDRR